MIGLFDGQTDHLGQVVDVNALHVVLLHFVLHLAVVLLGRGSLLVHDFLQFRGVLLDVECFRFCALLTGRH